MIIPIRMAEIAANATPPAEISLINPIDQSQLHSIFRMDAAALMKKIMDE